MNRIEEHPESPKILIILIQTTTLRSSCGPGSEAAIVAASLCYYGAGNREEAKDDVRPAD